MLDPVHKLVKEILSDSRYATYTDQFESAISMANRLIEKEKVQAVKDFITATYGERCEILDLVDFPELKDDPKASRCACCEMWEIYDSYISDQLAD